MTQYDYSKAQEPDFYKLRQDIINSELLNIEDYAGSSWSDDTEILSVMFLVELTQEQEADLDGIVAALPSGDSTPKPVTTVVNWNIPNVNSSAAVWTKIGSFIYCPHCFKQVPNKCAFISWVDPSVEGKFRVYDVTNNAVVYLSAKLNNADPVMAVGDLSNMPSDMSVFEFQVKRTSVAEGRIFADTVKLVIME